MEEGNMSIKEAKRLSIMQQIDRQQLKLDAAAEELRLSLRHMKRIRKKYREHGAIGLISQRRGHISPNKTPEKEKQQVIQLIARHYSDFGPTLAQEMLCTRHRCCFSDETIRQWMTEARLWMPKKQRKFKIYQRRARRSRFGDLIQADGSPHDWFEGRAPRCSLLLFVDDATSRLTAGKFVPAETTHEYQEVLQQHLMKYGRPGGMYVDKHSVFRVNQEEVKDGAHQTHFGKVLAALDIELIYAHSPQAKGRVERANGVLQDRLVKEMRLKGICSMEEANQMLPEFIKGYNKRFGKEPASMENGHRPLGKEYDLDRIFAYKHKRKLSKDLTFQYEGMLYQLHTDTPNRMRHAKVDVIAQLHKPILVDYEGRSYQYSPWKDLPYHPPKIMDGKALEAMWPMTHPVKPSVRHPWK